MSSPALAKQRWRNLVALTWPFAPDEIRSLLPPQLEPVVLDRHCRVTLAAFEVARVELPGPVVVPMVPSFFQVEIRTIVSDGKEEGVWYLKADASNAAVALGARTAFGIEMGTAEVEVEVTSAEEPEIRVSARKPRPDPISLDLSARASGVVRPASGPLEVAILGATTVWLRGEAGLKKIRIDREPPEVSRADVSALTETWLWSVGLRKPSGAPLGHYLRQTVISVHAPELVTRGA